MVKVLCSLLTYWIGLWPSNGTYIILALSIDISAWKCKHTRHILNCAIRMNKLMVANVGCSDTIINIIEALLLLINAKLSFFQMTVISISFQIRCLILAIWLLLINRVSDCVPAKRCVSLKLILKIILISLLLFKLVRWFDTFIWTNRSHILLTIFEIHHTKLLLNQHVARSWWHLTVHWRIIHTLIFITRKLVKLLLYLIGLDFLLQNFASLPPHCSLCLRNLLIFLLLVQLSR